MGCRYEIATRPTFKSFCALVLAFGLRGGLVWGGSFWELFCGRGPVRSTEQGMPTVFAGTQVKGGAGKSTFCQNLSVALHSSGYKTALLDADNLHSASLKWSRKRQDGSSAPDVIQAHQDGTPCSSDELRQLAAPYDAVVIDTPPVSTTALRSVVSIADVCMIPVPLSDGDFEGVRATLDVILRAPRQPKVGFVVRRGKARRLYDHVCESLAKLGTPFPVLTVPDLAAFQEATWFGKAAVDHAPSSKAALSFMGVAHETMKLLIAPDPGPGGGHRNGVAEVVNG